MTARPAFGAIVGDPGTLVFDDIPAWRGYLRSLAGKRVRVVVSRETRGRTLSQQGWLWGGIYPEIADWSGHTPDEIHAAMKELHGLKRLVTMPGCAQTLVPRSTADYSTEEFATYVERVRAWAANQGLNIPDPGRCA